ncbi:LysR family transcriptional regulator [Dinoroseobacter sp. S76]|uniref:LysR family transcriptional regulator n=1 Tax=Dinoroseobacter sp. S76 TaxID=3415124 RepID=UPI003C7D9CE4
MIKIEMLRCFAVVARTGNLSDAAAQLGRTQSAVSMTLKQLEETLGQKLFEGERKNALTPVGAQVLALAQQQVHSFDTAIRDIAATARSPRGLLRIVTIPSATGTLVPRAVETLVARHPGLKIDLRDAETEVVLDTLQRGEADIGIASGEPVLRGVESALLFRDAFGLTCARDHPLARRGGTLRVADVEAAAFVSNNLCRTLDHPGLQDTLVRAPLHAHNTLSLIGLLRQGRHVTVLPRSVVAHLPGALAFLPLEDLPLERSVSVLVAARASQKALAADCATLFQEISAAQS